MQKIASALGYDSVSAMLSDAMRCADEAAASALFAGVRHLPGTRSVTRNLVHHHSLAVAWEGGDAA